MDFVNETTTHRPIREAFATGLPRRVSYMAVSTLINVGDDYKEKYG